MKKTLTIALTLALSASSIVAHAAAQDQATRAHTNTVSEITEYRFDDHAVGGGTRGPDVGMVNGARARRRDTLVQPRIHYVNEMLKSVETL